MPIYRNIDDFPPGDTYAIIRTMNAASNGDTPSDIWFTIKTNLTDNDSMAVEQIHITVSGTGNGVITVNPDNSASYVVVSLVSNSYNLNTLSTYFYSIKVRMSPSNYVYTLESGKLFTTEVVAQLPTS